jgi:hypothetical protein
MASAWWLPATAGSTGVSVRPQRLGGHPPPSRSRFEMNVRSRRTTGTCRYIGTRPTRQRPKAICRPARHGSAGEPPADAPFHLVEGSQQAEPAGKEELPVFPATRRRSGTGSHPEPADRGLDGVEGNNDLHLAIVARVPQRRHRPAGGCPRDRSGPTLSTPPPPIRGAFIARRGRLDVCRRPRKEIPCGCL